MTFCCEIELDGVKYKCEYKFWGKQLKFNPKPDDETEQRLIPRAYELMHEYFWAIEEDCSRHDKPSDVHPVKQLDVIEVCLFKGLGSYEKIGGEYDCRFDAMQAVKEHALRSGKQQIYGLFENGLNTHIITTNGIYVELTEIPVHKQTRLEKV